jgi:hypothetical protein
VTGKEKYIIIRTMKTINILFCTAMFFITLFTFSQSIVIGTGAELNIGSNSDICASNWGNISGNITGSGTQCSGVLPVELISFSAAVENIRDVKLSWITASEINNSGFDIERKINENGWIKIAWLGGSGNSNIPQYYSYVDKGLNKGTYGYRLKQIDYNGNFEYFYLTGLIEISSPGIFSLSQNYPNPSNPVTVISYQIPSNSKVVIRVYDVSGREVAELLNKTQDAGYYDVSFDGSNLASGVYFYSIIASGDNNKYTATKKMLLVK